MIKLEPEVGMQVDWYPGGERTQQPLPALVTAVGPRTLTLHVLSRELRNFIIMDGVRHIDDQGAKKPELAELGAWDYAPWLKRLLLLEHELRGADAKKK